MPVDDELIDRFLDGDVSDGEAAEVLQWLESASDLKEFSRRAELHVDLRRSLRRRGIQSSAIGACDDVTDPASLASSPARSASRPKQVLALTIIGLVTAACFLLAFSRWDGGRNRESSPRMATIVSHVDALLTKDNQKWEGTILPAGSYQLQKGLLNLQFGGGVMVYIETPARFDAVRDKRVVLHSGRLSASVPPQGIGFTVETPEAEVVDFGTEFSVEVGSDASEVHVFDGLVRVQPGARKEGRAVEALDLRASQAVRISGSMAKPVDIEIARDRFIRNFDEPKRKYARSVKQFSPLAYYRMPIRDRGLVSEPPQHAGVVLTGDGVRPPHARGVFTGGSLRVRADSTGRGGRVDSPPPLNSGQFTLVVFVYLESEAHGGTVATNMRGDEGSFALSLDERGVLQAVIGNADGDVCSVAGDVILPIGTWRHVAVTADDERLQIYEDGRLVASTPCGTMAASDSDTVWFGTDAESAGLWDGRIDELALFGKALTEREISELYRIAKEEMARSK